MPRLNKEEVIPPFTRKEPVIMALPVTSNVAFGVEVPIPTDPDEVMRITSLPSVPKISGHPTLVDQMLNVVVELPACRVYGPVEIE